MEEGLVKKPNGKDGILGSSVTPLLVFSSVLAGFASLSNGCAVSFFILISYLFVTFSTW